MAKKMKKHPRDMTSEELAAHVFHPKLHEHLKRHIAESDSSEPVRKQPRQSTK